MTIKLNSGVKAMRQTDELPLLREVPEWPDEIMPDCPPNVVELIYSQMSRRADAVAVTDGDLEWTYRDLLLRSNMVASTLSARGVKRGSVVGMHLPRCGDAIAVIVGIMAAGCVYLPLDPSNPPARLRYMLDQAEVSAVVSPSSNPDLYGAERVWVASPSQLIKSELNGRSGDRSVYPAIELLQPEDPAYILFTSGSTGKPKGVTVTHKNLAVMNWWSTKTFDLTESDSSATACSLNFDPCFHEVLTPLTVGGAVHVIPDALALGALKRPVSLVSTTPTVLSELLRAGQLPPLKVAMVGGERLAPDVATRLLESGVNRLVHAYGPTECTVCVTVQEVTVPVPDVIPIGRAVPGSEVLIIDSDGAPLPDGETGEICIFGKQVAVGYVNNPAETALRFALDLSRPEGSQRYYRTGDRGYRTEDGSIYFCGRADTQVKINGIRIELAEIDAALRSHPEISGAVTAVRDDGRAIAYIVPEQPGGVIDIAELRSYLAKSLPRFMIPVGFMMIEKLPQNVNGKLDSSALPEWSPVRRDQDAVDAGDLDEALTQVIDIVARVTGHPTPIRPCDDFIDDLGGSSLGIVHVLVELQRISGRQIRINDALADTRISGLAALLRGDTTTPVADFAFNTEASAPPVFLIHAYLGGMLGLRHLAELLPADRPVYGLQVYYDSQQLGQDSTVSLLADNALRRIRQLQPEGQVTLVGQSAGGLIAFEVARKILEAGGPEPRLMVMDLPRPANSLTHRWGESVIYWRQAGPNFIRGRRADLRRLSAALWGSKASASLPDAHDIVALNEWNAWAIDKALMDYRVQPYDGSIAVMRTRQGQVMAMGRPALGWKSVTRGTLTVIDVPGSHLNMMDAPNVEVVTRKLHAWLGARS